MRDCNFIRPQMTDCNFLTNFRKTPDEGLSFHFLFSDFQNSITVVKETRVNKDEILNFIQKQVTRLKQVNYFIKKLIIF